MATFAPNMTKTPVQLLLGLVNNDNDLSITEADVELLAPQVVAEPDEYGRDTSIDIDLTVLPSEVDNDYVTFTYKRINIAEVFSVSGVTFREVDVPLNENGLPAEFSVFAAEILRKYGVAIDETNFAIALKSAGVITLSAVAGNVAYKGSVDVQVENSLATRVATTALTGFSKDAVKTPIEKV